MRKQRRRYDILERKYNKELEHKHRVETDFKVTFHSCNFLLCALISQCSTQSFILVCQLPRSNLYSFQVAKRQLRHFALFFAVRQAMFSHSIVTVIYIIIPRACNILTLFEDIKGENTGPHGPTISSPVQSLFMVQSQPVLLLNIHSKMSKSVVPIACSSQ